MVKVVVSSDLHLGITSSAAIRELASAIAVSSQMLWERYLPAAVADANMLWFEETTWQRDGIAVVGSLAWYDYSAVDPTIPFYHPVFFAGMKRAYNMDAVYVDWDWSDGKFAAQLGEALCARLQRLEDDSCIHAVLVVSHLPLFEEQMCRKPHDFDWGFSNAYFGNLTLGRQVLEKKKVQAVISGHTHIGMQGKVKRSGFKGSFLPVSVLASDYYAPTYLVINAESQPTRVTLKATDTNQQELWSCLILA